MAEGQRMTAADVVAQVRDGRLEDFVREAVVLVARELMEAEVSEQVGAGHGEAHGLCARREQQAVIGDFFAGGCDDVVGLGVDRRDVPDQCTEQEHDHTGPFKHNGRDAEGHHHRSSTGESQDHGPGLLRVCGTPSGGAGSGRHGK